MFHWLTRNCNGLINDFISIIPAYNLDLRRKNKEHNNVVIEIKNEVELLEPIKKNQDLKKKRSWKKIHQNQIKKCHLT
jgi:hypothetical protein